MVKQHTTNATHAAKAGLAKEKTMKNLNELIEDRGENEDTLEELIEEFGETVVRTVAECYDAKFVDQVREKIEDHYEGEYNSKMEWAEEFMDGTGQLESIPSYLRMYFDFESFARDCELGGDVYFAQDSYGMVYVFHN